MKNNYLTVSALTKYIKRKMETDHHLQSVWLKGEISNFYLHQRGHMYLTIKDDQTKISAVMFKGYNQFLKYKPENGMQVLIEGEVNVYEPYGQYQLYIKKMQPDGIGSLFFAFEQMKDKLQLKGYFEKDRKRSIPQYPKNIAVVTSPYGAAVQDIINTIKRRNPYVTLTVIPTTVQGIKSSQSIANSIQLANKLNYFDVLIVGRGGGSIEDLWGFNEEVVAEAIYHSQTPVISAVGHETDVTISDYVADLRAITPTAAAELAVQRWDAIVENYQQIKQQTINSFQYVVTRKNEKLTQFKNAYAFHLPQQLIFKSEQQVDQHQQQLSKSIKNKLHHKQQKYLYIAKQLYSLRPQRQIKLSKDRLSRLKPLLNRNTKQKLEKKQQQINDYIDKLLLLNPLEIMKRGYAIPYKDQKIIKSVEEVKVNEQLNLKLVNGQLNCHISEIERDETID